MTETFGALGSLLTSLQWSHVGLAADGDALLIRAAPGVLTPYLERCIAHHQPLILRCLQLAGPGRPITLGHLTRAQRELETEF